MEWKNGFSAAYYAYIVDPATWRETTKIQLTGGKISRTASGLRDSADLDCVSYPQGTEHYLRVYMDTKQDGTGAHVPLFTGLASSPAQDFDGIYETNTVKCYSVLKGAADILLDRGFYIPAEANGATAIKTLLEVIPAPVITEEDAPTLTNAIIAESGETHASMVDKILMAINWRLRIDGAGTIHIEKQPMDSVAQLDPIENDVIEPSISIEYDWYSAPNVFRAIQQDLSATARDDDPESPLSTVSRGREVWAEETSCKLNIGESISQYALRRLKELQAVAKTAEYTRRFNPNIYVGDLIRLRYPEQGLEGIFKVKSQSITIGSGSPTEEEVEAWA